MSKLKFHSVVFGCDPEFFFKKKDGSVVGAEFVLPDEGLKCVVKDKKVGGKTAVGEGHSNFIIDGVQAELNVRPNSCRANLGFEISAALKHLKETKLKDTDINADFSQGVELKQTELDGLSDKYQKFGCSPSLNVYNQFTGGKNVINVDPKKYLYRSAGGHIHLGVPTIGDERVKKALENPHLTIPVLDLIVGNTLVIIDRDPVNSMRRQVYGKAGEHRTPKHGLEYRTPSNYWLKSYPLMGLAMGLSRLAVNIVANSYDDDRFVRELFKRISMSHVYRTINFNSVEDARYILNQIMPLLLEFIPNNDLYPIHSGISKEFNYFLNNADKYFKEDVIEHWTNLNPNNAVGFEKFLKTVVREDMKIA